MMRPGGRQVAGDTERPAASGTQPGSGGPSSPAPDEPSVVQEFEKGAAEANADARPAPPAAKPEEGDDDWYLRTGQPAPDREGAAEPDEGGDEGTGNTRLAVLSVGVVVLLVALIVLFGVFLS